jgi:hypothetical protein
MATTAVASTTSSTQLLAADPNRESVVIANSDANDLYVLFDDGTASASNLSAILIAKDVIEVPKQYVKGRIMGIWAADGSGSAHMTTR